MLASLMMKLRVPFFSFASEGVDGVVREFVLWREEVIDFFHLFACLGGKDYRGLMLLHVQYFLMVMF